MAINKINVTNSSINARQWQQYQVIQMGSDDTSINIGGEDWFVNDDVKILDCRKTYNGEDGTITVGVWQVGQDTTEPNTPAIFKEITKTRTNSVFWVYKGTDDDGGYTINVVSAGAAGETISTDATITGDGTSGDPLTVAHPFTQTHQDTLDSALQTVATDSTITGDGTSGSALAVANPFTEEDEARLDAMDDNATDDQTPAELRTAIGTLTNTEIDTGTATDAKLTTAAGLRRSQRVPAYNAGTTYERGDMVRDSDGNHYVYTHQAASSGQTPATNPETWQRVGNSIPQWQSGAHYPVGSVVYVSGGNGEATCVFVLRQAMTTDLQRTTNPQANPQWSILNYCFSVWDATTNGNDNHTAGSVVRYNNQYYFRVNVTTIDNTTPPSDDDGTNWVKFGGGDDSSGGEDNHAAGTSQQIQTGTEGGLRSWSPSVLNDAIVALIGTTSDYQGAFVSGTQYNVGNIVLHANCLYILVEALQASDLTVSPPGNDHWRVMESCPSQWVSTIQYPLGAVVHINGTVASRPQLYMKTAAGGGSESPDQLPAYWTRIGNEPAGIQQYSNTATYSRGDMVYQGTCAYVWMGSDDSTAGVLPNADEDWHLITNCISLAGDGHNLPVGSLWRTGNTVYIKITNTTTSATNPTNDPDWVNLGPQSTTYNAGVTIMNRGGIYTTGSDGSSSGVYIWNGPTGGTTTGDIGENENWVQVGAVSVQGESDGTGSYVYIQGDGTADSPLGIRKATVRNAIGSVVANEAQGTFNDSSTLGLVTGRAIDNALDNKVNTSSNPLLGATLSVSGSQLTLTGDKLTGSDTTSTVTLPSGGGGEGEDNPPTGTSAQLSTGTQTALRSWSPSIINAGIDSIISATPTAEAWEDGRLYVVGDIVMDNNCAWVCTTNLTDDDTENAQVHQAPHDRLNWKWALVSTCVTTWDYSAVQGNHYRLGDFTFYNQALWYKRAFHHSEQNPDVDINWQYIGGRLPTYSATAGYFTGNIVLAGDPGKPYMRIDTGSGPDDSGPLADTDQSHWLPLGAGLSSNDVDGTTIQVNTDGDLQVVDAANKLLSATDRAKLDHYPYNNADIPDLITNLTGLTVSNTGAVSLGFHRVQGGNGSIASQIPTSTILSATDRTKLDRYPTPNSTVVNTQMPRAIGNIGITDAGVLTINYTSMDGNGRTTTGAQFPTARMVSDAERTLWNSHTDDQTPAELRTALGTITADNITDQDTTAKLVTGEVLKALGDTLQGGGGATGVAKPVLIELFNQHVNFHATNLYWRDTGFAIPENETQLYIVVDEGTAGLTSDMDPTVRTITVFSSELRRLQENQNNSSIVSADDNDNITFGTGSNVTFYLGRTSSNNLLIATSHSGSNNDATPLRIYSIQYQTSVSADSEIGATEVYSGSPTISSADTFVELADSATWVDYPLLQILYDSDVSGQTPGDKQSITPHILRSQNIKDLSASTTGAVGSKQFVSVPIARVDTATDALFTTPRILAVGRTSANNLLIAISATAGAVPSPITVNGLKFDAVVHSALTQDDVDAGTSTTAGLVSPAVLKAGVEAHAPPGFLQGYTIWNHDNWSYSHPEWSASNIYGENDARATSFRPRKFVFGDVFRSSSGTTAIPQITLQGASTADTQVDTLAGQTTGQVLANTIFTAATGYYRIGTEVRAETVNSITNAMSVQLRRVKNSTDDVIILDGRGYGSPFNDEVGGQQGISFYSAQTLLQSGQRYYIRWGTGHDTPLNRIYYFKTTIQYWGN